MRIRDLKIHRLPWLRRTCKQVTHLLLEAQDHKLRPMDRVALRLHMLICDTCPKFMDQMKLMRTALGRWRQYRDDDAQ
jgi:hypothetical protein